MTLAHCSASVSCASRRASLRGLSGLFTASALLGLGACSSVPSSGPAGAPWPAPAPRSTSNTPPPNAALPENPLPPPAEASTVPPAPAIAPIVNEKRWLEEWFARTPVVIRQLNDSTLQLTVPMANSFDTGQLPPKPALVAVLDRLAESMRRQLNTRLAVVISPDNGAPTSQALNRAQRVTEHLGTRRVQAQRVVTSRVGLPGAAVQLQLQFLPAPVM
jgi:hypothetical protein